MDILLIGTPQHAKFTSGSITLTQGTLFRTKAFQPFITDYQHKVEPESVPYKPLNFRRGRLGITVTAYVRMLFAPSVTHQFARGSITIQRTGVAGVGGLSKFALWTSGYPTDPADMLLESASPVTGVAGAQQAWSRISSVVHPSSSARFLGLGGKFTNVPHSPTGGTIYRNYTRKVQVEKAYVDGVTTYPTAYERARQVNVTVRPTRVNLVAGEPAAGANTTKTSGVAFDGSTWFRFTSTGASSLVRQSVPVGVLRTGEYYTSQWEVANDGASPVTITLDWCDADPTPYVILPGTRKIISVTSNRNGLPYDSTYKFTDIAIPTSANILVRNVMVEKGKTLRPYFDGSTNADTIWGGTVGNSMSFLYKDRVARYAALQRILAKNVPLGIGIGDPQFGTLPADW